MLKRDFCILLLAAFAVYFALHGERSFSFRKAWCELVLWSALLEPLPPPPLPPPAVFVYDLAASLGAG